MMNYIKSELYRVFHSVEIYSLTGVISILLLMLNGVLAIFSKEGHFPYGNVGYSLGILVSAIQIIIACGAIVVSFLYSERRKNSAMKNTIAYGISREGIFLGDCMVSILAGLLSMAVILAAFVGSACLLLDRTGMEIIEILFRGIAAVLPSVFAGVILYVWLDMRNVKEMKGMLIWLSVMDFVPSIVKMLGYRVELLARAASWMPWNLFGVQGGMSSGITCIWQTSEGFAKCWAAGGLGMVIFLVLGLWSVRRIEL